MQLQRGIQSMILDEETMENIDDVINAAVDLGEDIGIAAPGSNIVVCHKRKAVDRTGKMYYPWSVELVTI